MLPDHVSHDAVIACALADTAGLVRSAHLFDLYKPKTVVAGIGANERSLAIRLELRDDENTLTEERIEAATGAAVSRLQSQLGARLRA